MSREDRSCDLLEAMHARIQKNIHSLQGLAKLHDHLGENCVGCGAPERPWALVD